MTRRRLLAEADSRELTRWSLFFAAQAHRESDGADVPANEDDEKAANDATIAALMKFATPRRG